MQQHGGDGAAAARSLEEVRGALAQAVARGSEAMINRKGLAELVFLGLVAQENLLLIGPPGTGKSAAARIAAEAVGGRYFEYLIGRFTEPSEIFGPLDLEALQRGEVRPDVSGMLPEAEFAFLDEIFLGSTAILNTLLGVLNERRYRRGVVDIACPLKCCVAASNHFPEDPMLRAFADRFLLTSFIDPVGDHALEALLEAGWRFSARNGAESGALLNMAEIARLTEAAKQVDVSGVRDAYAHILRKLRGRGVHFSDRRIVKGQTLIASAAAVAGRDKAEASDLWPVVFMAQDRATQTEVRDLLQDELSASANAVFADSAQTASTGAAARAEELRAYGVALLEERPHLASGAAWENWLVKAESLLTQIDAGFSADGAPAALASLRDALTAQVRAAEQSGGDAEPAGGAAP